MNARSNDPTPTVDLSRYQVSGYAPGAGVLRRALWHIAHEVLFASAFFPFYRPKRWMLRLFGANVGRGVIIKPRVRIKHPWRLSIGEHTWIGEGVWIDNLVPVTIGRNVCISQGAYLLNGNHNYKSIGFSLITAPIVVEDGVWIGARGVICPGVTLRRNAIVTVGSVLTHDTKPDGIYSGIPAQWVRRREFLADEGSDGHQTSS